MSQPRSRATGDRRQTPTVDRTRRPTRRRVVTLLAFLLLLAGVILVNVGPLRDLRRAEARVVAKQQQVSQAEEENRATRAETERLQRSENLEALARKELNYARPGEKVYIVKGQPTTTTTTVVETPVGPLERLVRSVRDLVR